MDNEEVAQRAEEAGLSLIRFLYCDTNSIIRGKNVPIPSPHAQQPRVLDQPGTQSGRRHGQS
ncbi:MAG: hypothetical protein ACK2U5_13725, partial [Candidatus Promineifilaceae bacterium]